MDKKYVYLRSDGKIYQQPADSYFKNSAKEVISMEGLTFWKRPEGESNIKKYNDYYGCEMFVWWPNPKYYTRIVRDEVSNESIGYLTSTPEKIEKSRLAWLKKQAKKEVKRIQKERILEAERIKEEKIWEAEEEEMNTKAPILVNNIEEVAGALYIINKKAKNHSSDKRDDLYDLKDRVINKALEKGLAKKLGYHKATYLNFNYGRTDYSYDYLYEDEGDEEEYIDRYYSLYRFGSFLFHRPVDYKPKKILKDLGDFRSKRIIVPDYSVRLARKILELFLKK